MVTWAVFPARNGILLQRKLPDSQGPDTALDEANPPEWRFLQPNDSRLDGGGPPLALELDDKELSELSDPRLVAATHFGKPAQEKAANEDFACTAVIRAGGREFAFAAVADGVSTRTFWSARAARLACLGAYKALCAAIADGASLADASAVAPRIAATINDAMARDAEILESARAVPEGWSEQIYEKYKKDDASWYRTTLLFGIAGEAGGFIGITGDGGVRAFRVNEGDPEIGEVRVMSAAPQQDLTSYVARGYSSSDIAVIPIQPREKSVTHVLFASDGFDLTLQALAPTPIEGEEGASRYRDLPLSRKETALAFLDALAGREETVFDNLSIARLSWPLPPKGAQGAGAWATWTQQAFPWTPTPPAEPPLEKEDKPVPPQQGFWLSTRNSALILLMLVMAGGLVAMMSTPYVCGGSAPSGRSARVLAVGGSGSMPLLKRMCEMLSATGRDSRLR